MKESKWKTLFEIFAISTKLGLTSFGGPIAHLGYFHEEYIRRRKWLDEKSYADLVALCHFLPGPASSQAGIGIGLMRGGILGGLCAFIGFTFPSAIALMIFALILKELHIVDAGWIHGLKIVAAVVVAHAVIGMAQKLAPDLGRKAIALGALVVTLLWQHAFSQVVVMLLAAFIGFLLYKKVEEDTQTSLQVPISTRFAASCLFLFFGLLLFLPLLKVWTSSYWIGLFDSFYRSGSLVFGGGHVVLPLLEQEFVPTGMLTEKEFLAGYGAAQAVPGPLFTFASYIGAVMNGWAGGFVATCAIFLPAILLIFGTLPFWGKLRSNSKINGALMGIQAAVVGILIAAFYDPIWISSINRPIDFAFAAILFSMLAYWKIAPWIIVLTGAIGGLFL
ncbi:chromate efflux transporter [Aeribacillus pallidus]|uniref:chromate efflux transporter n=1 Tax=Aeribacillus TaxID=1055323 RepID=UPI0007B45C84|nr:MULTISPECIES: chromate efflux transporter [Aeribacillus]KZM54752.1 ChrA protein [Aeribacillus pallidus]MED0650424.1 chromate efflux transporter [Aeribacillus composti]MED4487404.1 chromate efflux transporter [Aeribacillus pallidus]